jgi:hypothetical protein
MQNKKRVTINKRTSSLSLGYQSMTESTNDYTRQLVTSALNLPLTTHLNIKSSNTLSHTQDEKVIELLHPRLLKSSIRKPKSAPCSPTKSVQFDKENLEDICYFKKAQTPLTISYRKNIFWATFDDESEQEEQVDLIFSNWPSSGLNDVIDKRNKVIRIEKSSFEVQDDVLIGKLLVRNLDYQKTVNIRYTFDYWETVQNVQAIYQSNYPSNTIYDVFTFNIDITSDSLYFAIQYQVGSQEFWDNNDSKNYEIQFIHNNKKKEKKKEELLKKRYDFSQSIHQAKQSLLSSITTSTMVTTSTSTTVPIDISSRRHHHHHHHHQSKSANSSPTSSYCHSPLASSPSMELNSPSYMDLVSKYCFYGSSPTRSPMSTY